ncbi:MAG TPA: MBL fold metallo-hydrolase, partial [Lachnospiraceae bacterium]|nr:MBL fold metallo-hydrolase [Lachnospiraceae bacterium]
MKTLNLKEGTITSNEYSDFIIHTYTSSESACLVNSHIIETSKHLILIDTQYMLPNAWELKEYIDSIGKPIERVIISHSHPDHWFGNEYYKNEKIYALKEILSVLEIAGDAMIKNYQHLNDNRSLVPTQKTLPTFLLDEEMFTVDDVELSVIKYTNTEDSVITGIEIPKEQVLIAQDIVYDSTHAFTAQSPDVQRNWIQQIENIQSKNYKLVLGGHGIPSGGDILTPALSYLHDASAAILNALSSETDKESKVQIYCQTMLDIYPTLGGQLLLQLSA